MSLKDFAKFIVSQDHDLNYLYKKLEGMLERGEITRKEYEAQRAELEADLHKFFDSEESKKENA